MVATDPLDLEVERTSITHDVTAGAPPPQRCPVRLAVGAEGAVATVLGL